MIHLRVGHIEQMVLVAYLGDVAVDADHIREEFRLGLQPGERVVGVGVVEVAFLWAETDGEVDHHLSLLLVVDRFGRPGGS